MYVQSLGSSKTVSHGPEGTKVIIVISIRKKTSYHLEQEKQKSASMIQENGKKKWGH